MEKFEFLLIKQDELMDKVPHGLRYDSAVLMTVSIKIISSLLEFLNSTGHKPWRPNPLPVAKQREMLSKLEHNVNFLVYLHEHFPIPTVPGGPNDEHRSRQMVSSFGIIEETIEHLEALDKDDSDNQLEELTDILFFYLEQMLLSGFSFNQVVEEYHSKWAVNIKRYEDAKAGNYSWDKRSEGGL